MYHRIYSPEGDLFEVPASRVRPLQDKGWTMTFPEDLSSVFADDSVNIIEPDESEERFVAVEPTENEPEESLKPKRSKRFPVTAEKDG